MFVSNYQKREKKPFFTTGETMTNQESKEECDINNILAKYNKTGVLPTLIKQNPIYGDFSEALDYQQSLEVISKAEMQFKALPAKARDKFQNDPVKFLEFVHDPKNAKEMEELGLATKKETTTTPVVTTPQA